MEDAHSTILDLQPLEGNEELKPAASDVRISFFGVYDGHGGDKVALYTGEHLHEIIAKQDAFKNGQFEQALKDGFLAIDRSILSGKRMLLSYCYSVTDNRTQIHATRKKFLAAPPRSQSFPMTKSMSYVDKGYEQQETVLRYILGQRRRFKNSLGCKRQGEAFVF